MKTPERQTNYQVALNHALAHARSRSAENLAVLGARETGPGRYELPVLESVFQIDLGDGGVTLPAPGPAGGGARPHIGWQILALHYLAADVPWPACAAWIGFADIPDGRGYESVYRARVIGRLCATAGRDRARFVEASRRLGARSVDLGDEAFRFAVFPRLDLTLVWYAPDEEFGPGVSFLYPDNVLAFLSVEDVVVLSEGLAARLHRNGW
jgi:hypothetical protein